MRFLATVNELPLSLLITSFALAGFALPAGSTSLTPENFHSTIAKGVWFIEHFSPYCGHCQAFAPTWEKLVEASENAGDSDGVRLAQVNCAVHGDLCDENGVKGYPSLNMYRDGGFVELFEGAREYDRLTAFIAKYAKPSVPTSKQVEQPEPTNPLLNPDGTVLVLDDNTFHETIAQGPAFIKFFAPWCGHCKRLAPAWKQLARHMQSKVTIAEVNCEEHDALCKSQNVAGYPTLAYYSDDGMRSEYSGGRKLEQLKAFTEKASSPAVREITVDELTSVVADDSVVYLLLHSPSDSDIVKTISKAARPLLGSPQIYTSSSLDLFTRYSIYASIPWALLSLKDHNLQTPASTFLGSDSLDEQALERWLFRSRLPTTLELTQDTFQGVMNAPQQPLVVIAAVTKENREKVAEKFRDVGLKWRVRTGGSGQVGDKETGRDVVFTWMDVEKWGDWMKSMYNIKKVEGTGTGLEDVTVVVADHKRLVFYDVDQTGQPITPTSTSIFSAIEGAAWGHIKAKHSENLVERMARYLNGKIISIEAYVRLHPMHAVFFAGCAIVLLVLGVRRLVASDMGMEREYGGGYAKKGGRLD